MTDVLAEPARLAGLAAVALAMLACLLLGARMLADNLAARRAVRARVRLLRPGAPAGEAAPGPLRRIGDALARTPLVGSAEVQLLRQNLYAAGMTGPGAVDRFIGFKIMLAATLLLLALLWAGRLAAAGPVPQALLLLGALLVGLRGPDLVVGRRAAARRRRIDDALPDALDLMVVCAEAGIGIEPALERVSVELRPVHPDLAGELSITVSEMRFLADRLQGLQTMGDRVRLESVRTIATTLSQTLRYGTPLGRALRTLAADFRLVRQTRMEAAAARLPVLITIPMILFILPATTLVVAGPAFLQLIDALGRM